MGRSTLHNLGEINSIHLVIPYASLFLYVFSIIATLGTP